MTQPLTLNPLRSRGLFWLAVGVSTLVGVFVYEGFVGRGDQTTETSEEIDYMVVNPVGEQVQMRVGEVELMVEIRDTDEGRGLGLSGRENLGEDEGMLFVFDQPLRPTFWMKDMRFDLDMVWIYEGEVVQITEGMPAPRSSDDRIATIQPDVAVDMVLEVVSGWVEKNGIEVEDSIEIIGY